MDSLDRARLPSQCTDYAYAGRIRIKGSPRENDLSANNREIIEARIAAHRDRIAREMRERGIENDP